MPDISRGPERTTYPGLRNRRLSDCPLEGARWFPVLRFGELKRRLGIGHLSCSQSFVCPLRRVQKLQLQMEAIGSRLLNSTDLKVRLGWFNQTLQ